MKKPTELQEPPRGWNASITDLSLFADAVATEFGKLSDDPNSLVQLCAEFGWHFGVDPSYATKKIAELGGENVLFPIPFQTVQFAVHRAYRDLNQNGAPGRWSVAATPEDAEERPSDFVASDFAGLEVPEQKWIVPNWIPADDVVQNMGDGGAGKTTLMLQLLVAKATGREWLGMETGKAAPVLFVSGEERRDKIHARINWILNGASTPYAGAGALEWGDLAGFHILGLADRNAILAAADKRTGRVAPTPLYDLLERRIGESNAALVVIDALYDVFSGDQNSVEQARAFIRLLRRLCLKHRCAIVITGHPSLTGMNTGSGTSGSVGWRNASRSFIYVRVDRGKAKNSIATHVLESKKQNYGTPDAKIDTVWSNGIFVPVETDPGDAEAAKAKFMELLHTYIKEGRAVSATPSVSYAPKVFAGDDRCGGVSKEAFHVAMNALFAENKITQRDYQRANRNWARRIERVSDAAEADFG